MRLRVAASALLGCLAVTAALADDDKQSRTPFTALDLLAMRQIGGESGELSVSPDGRLVAFQIREPRFDRRSYDLDWYVAAIEGGSPVVRVAEGGDVLFYPATFGRLSGAQLDVKPLWSPDGLWIAFLRRDADQVQVWRARADGFRYEAVTTSAADVLDFKWRPDGRGIVFRVGRTREEIRKAEEAESDQGYLIDDRFAPTHSSAPLSFNCDNSFAGIRAPSSQPCSTQLRTATFEGSPEREATVEEARTFRGTDQTYRPASGRTARNAVWNSSHQRVAWFENEDPERNRGFAAPLTVYADGHRCRLKECRGKLHSVWWSSRDDEVVFHRSEGHADSVHAVYAWQPRTGSLRSIYKSDGYLGSCEPAKGTLICVHETPQTPRKIVRIDVRAATTTTVYDPNPGFDSFKLGTVEKLEWLDGYGNPTFGHLVYPSDYRPSRRYPMVVVQYRSRGFLSGGVGNEYPIFPLAERGFLVLSFDRPEDESIFARYPTETLEGFAAALTATHGDAYTHRQALTALQAIIERLAQRNLIDTGRIGITGLSNGAETVDYALTHSNLFAAAVVSGNASPLQYYQEVNASLRTLIRAMYAARDGEAVLRNSARVSLARRAEMVQAPLLMQVSDRELISAVPALVALEDAHKPVEAYVFPDEYHVKWQPQHKLAAAERALDWFAFWLKNEEDPSTGKQEQYKRWRALQALRVGE